MKSSRLRLRRSTSSQSPVANDGSPSLGERRLHYERGSTIYSTDGSVGVLTQVVVDEAAGEVTDLIVRIDNADADVLLPPDLVDRTVDSANFLTINRAQFSERAADAARVNPSEFAKANPKTVSKNGLIALERNPRRAVITASPNHLDTLAASGSQRLDRLQSTAGVPIAAPIRPGLIARRISPPGPAPARAWKITSISHPADRGSLVRGCTRHPGKRQGR